MKQPLLLLGVAPLALTAMPVLASEAAESEALDETGAASNVANTRRTFTPEDFARFAPRNALDMARQVPGFSIREGDGARGLGAADTNVIINGRRISGKSNGPVEALRRIPVEEVVRLELVDGASLDIGGLTGQVLNVITSNSGGISGQFRYSPQFRSEGTPLRWRDAEVSVAGGSGKSEWNLALRSNSNRFNDFGPELVFDGTGALIDTRDEEQRGENDTLSLSGGYSRTADNGNILNLIGEVNGFFRRSIETSDRSGSISPVDRQRVFTSREDEFNFEVSADYQFALGPGRLKLIGYHRYEDSPTEDESTTFFADGSAPEGTLFIRDADEGETIARAEYSVPALGGDLLLSAEGVRNFLEINAALDSRDADGILQPVQFSGATARVDEDRAEVGATYSRALAPNLQFQVSAGAEYSRISQSGAQGLTRTFYRPKGFVSLDWKASQSVSISGRIERVVGQLNFFDFIASVDLNQDRTDVTNANLVPQQSWVVEVEASLGLGALGSFNVRPFYEDITDIVDQIPIEGGGQAPGNVPSAERYGIDAELTLLSEGIGWRGTRLDISLSLRESSIADPLLGIDRELSGNDKIDLIADIRHDFPGTSWAIGSAMSWEDNDPRVRLDEIALRRESFPGFASVFVENKDVAGLTVRANIGNVISRTNRFDRTVFIDRAAGIVDFVEDRDRTFGTIFTLDIEGSF